LIYIDILQKVVFDVHLFISALYYNTQWGA